MPAYLKLTGFEGNVTKKEYAGWIEVESYSWGFSVPVQTTVGSSSNRLSAGKVTPGDLHIVKKQDKTSGKMMIDSMNGVPITDATLAITTLSKSGAEDKYMEYKMSEVIVSSFSTGGSQGQHEPMENVSINMAKIEIAQFSKDVTGSVAQAQRGGFDFTTGAQV
jgi:type VI secretion system secreted protein Hcp